MAYPLGSMAYQTRPFGVMLFKNTFPGPGGPMVLPMPMLDAANAGNEEAVLAWLSHRGHIDARAVDDGVASGCTLLEMAAVSGETSLVQLLLRHGADPNVVDNSGKSALCRAAGSLKSEDEARDIVQALLAAGASVNLETDFYTAKMLKREVVAKLLEEAYLLQHDVPRADW